MRSIYMEPGNDLSVVESEILEGNQLDGCSEADEDGGRNDGPCDDGHALVGGEELVFRHGYSADVKDVKMGRAEVVRMKEREQG